MKFSLLLSAVLGAAMLSGCAGEKTNASVEYSENAVGEAAREVFAMDTDMTLKAYGKNAEEALNDAEAEIYRLDRLFRRGSEESEVYKINHSEAAEVSADTAELLETALTICERTDGAFDITIAPVMDLWGFYTRGFHIPTETELSPALAKVNYRDVSVAGSIVSVKNGSQIDLGGIAKGYLSSQIMDLMAKDGVASGIVSLGGNVQALGCKPDGSKWRVAIQDPDSESAYIGAVSISDQAVITSGGYQRYFEQDGSIYHHIIDPSTGFPAVSGLKSVTIVSDDGTLADGLSTSLFVMGLDKGTEYWKNHGGFDFIVITEDNRIYVTEGIADSFDSQLDYSVIKK